MAKREVDIVVLSDIHLGTYGCHAKELLQYLKSIKPKAVVLNGDIIDIWQFSKRYWPATHMMVVKHLIGLIAKEVPVYFIPGNHDEMVRKFKGFQMGSLKITNKLSLKINGSRAWIFHGDVFDVVMQHSKWLAKLGAIGYDTLILINRFVNFISDKMGRGKVSLSKKIKNSVKGAVKFINNFESTVCDIAAENDYKYVICGHIHHPEIKTVITEKGPVVYMNSGDWIENLTSLEYNDGEWSIYRYADDAVAQAIDIDKKKQKETPKQLMASLMMEMNLKQNNKNGEISDSIEAA
jgi:UDP-2,3-diacylglucosamine pyrophosphatase LpxH